MLQAARLVQSMELTDKNDFGYGCHMASTEPFFYDSAYKLVKKEYELPIVISNNYMRISIYLLPATTTNYTYTF